MISDVQFPETATAARRSVLMSGASLLSLWKRLPVIVRAVLAGALATTAGTLPWAALVAANIKVLPAIPWSVPIAALYIWLLFRYLRGAGWPAATAQARRESCRANDVPGDLFGGAIVAGIVGLVALLLFQSMFTRMVRLPQQPVDDLRHIPAFTLMALIVMGSVVAGVIEEAGFRGYMQGPIERRHGPVVAILVTSALFGLAHYSHRETTLALMPFYMGVGVIYGLMAYLSGSIWPSLFLHTLGDVFGAFQVLATGRAEWQAAPATTPLIWDIGTDATFWLTAFGFAVATAAAIAAYRSLASARNTVGLQE